jgi:hypothetical protein
MPDRSFVRLSLVFFNSEHKRDLVLGTVSAAVRGFIFSGPFGMSGVTGLNIWSIIVSTT